MIFTEEEIKKMEEDVKVGRMSFADGLWRRAFAFFNEQNKCNYSIGCRYCYGKVLSFIKSLNNENRHIHKDI